MDKLCTMFDESCTRDEQRLEWYTDNADQPQSDPRGATISILPCTAFQGHCTAQPIQPCSHFVPLRQRFTPVIIHSNVYCGMCGRVVDTSTEHALNSNPSADSELYARGALRQLSNVASLACQPNSTHITQLQ